MVPMRASKGAESKGAESKGAESGSPVLSVRVVGVPATQGSAKGFVVTSKAGKSRAVVTHDDKKKLLPWRGEIVRVLRAARLVLGHSPAPRAPAPPNDPSSDPPLFHGPVSVRCEFILPRLAGHPKTPRGRPVPLPSTGLDLDKLQRSLGDALTESRVVRDDTQVCHWDATKRYAALGEPPGVTATVRPLGGLDTEGP